MRLSLEQIDQIRQNAAESFGPEASVWLFGSRVDDSKRGDDMGTRLIPAILRALEEDTAAMSVVDRLNRLEQLGWLPSAAECSELRRLLNAFAHDSPETPAVRQAQWRLAMAAAERVLTILDGFAVHMHTVLPI